MEPLVPAIVDLRDFAYMPLDVVRLRDSRLASAVSGEGFRCAVLLWCVSWHQIPAASLPDDDVLLSQYAGFGRSVRDWRKVRQQALHGWTLCDDGRFYHPTVAEKALEAWDQRLAQRWRTECARIKKAAQRKGSSPEYPTLEEWKEHFQATGLDAWCPDGVPNQVPGDSGGASPGTTGNVPRETASKGREGKGREGIEDQEQTSSSSTAAPSTDLLGPKPDPADLRHARAQRLAQVTDEAIASFNTSPLTKANGGLVPNISSTVGREKRQQQVAKCLRVARQICAEDYKSLTITAEFWTDYWATCCADEHKSGRRGGGRDHPNWKPSFEYLTREETMLELYDRASAEDAA